MQNRVASPRRGISENDRRRPRKVRAGGTAERTKCASIVIRDRFDDSY